MTRVVDIEESGAGEQDAAGEDQQSGGNDEEKQEKFFSLRRIKFRNDEFWVVRSVKAGESRRRGLISPVFAELLVEGRALVLQRVDASLVIDH